MKFGGTSVQDAACLSRAASIVARCRDEMPLVVVSAVAGVTRRLLELGEAAARSETEAIDRELAAIEALHRAILYGIDPRSEHQQTELDAQAVRLSGLVSTIAGAAVYTPAAQDALLSSGERFSSALFVAAATAAGLSATAVDAASVIVTDDRHRHARPDLAETGRRARQLIPPLVEDGYVPVVEGFIGATPAGVPTTMGFEASDLTASLLGASLGAAEVQIWTDVPGMLTTGHPAVAQPRVVPRLSFDEAAELALFGAKVLHPDSIAPARERGIPVRILHSRNPGGAGTWIAEPTDDQGTPRVKSIAVTEDPDDESFETVRAAIGGGDEGAWNWDGRAVVCPVGEGIGSADELAGRIEQLVAEVTAALSLPRRPHAIPMVVPRAKLAAVVRCLHDALVDGDG